jgi:hypothetical protein
MFCGNCGSESVEGNHYCTTCGREQSPTPAAKSLVASQSEGPKPPATTTAVRLATSTPPADRTVNSTVALAKPAERPVYCRHSPSERSTLRRYEQDGTELCTGCKLPYAPGSPGYAPESPGSRRPGSAADTTWMTSAPPNHFAWAILSLVFLCWPLGIPAVVYANRVNEKWAAGDHAGAQSASQSAKDFATWATIAGSLIYFISIIYFFAVMGAVAGSLP